MEADKIKQKNELAALRATTQQVSERDKLRQQIRDRDARRRSGVVVNAPIDEVFFGWPQHTIQNLQLFFINNSTFNFYCNT